MSDDFPYVDEPEDPKPCIYCGTEIDSEDRVVSTGTRHYTEQCREYVKAALNVVTDEAIALRARVAELEREAEAAREGAKLNDNDWQEHWSAREARHAEAVASLTARCARLETAVHAAMEAREAYRVTRETGHVWAADVWAPFAAALAALAEEKNT